MDDRTALDLLIRGFQVSRAIRLVADLGLADRLASQEVAHIDELAAAAEVRAEQLKRVVRALSAFGVFTMDAEGKVAHTPRSLLLRSDAPGSLHHSARFWTGRGSWRAWEALDEAMTGKSPHEAVWGTSRFAYLSDHEDEARAFDAFMANFPDDRHAAVAQAYDFSNAGLIADIGGGNGEMLRQILGRYPTARGVVFDRPDVVTAIASDRLAEGRLSVQGGNFFEELPEGCDTYMMVRVLHDWSDEDAVRILRRCKAAMNAGGRLLVVEGLLPANPSEGRPTEYLIDLQMMAMFGSARERTEAEFAALLEEAGLELARVVATRSAVSVIEAILPG